MSFFQKSSRMRRTHTEIDGEILTAPKNTREIEGFTFDRGWFVLLMFIVIAALCALGSRVFYLSVVQHEHYREIASGNTQREQVIIAPRGKIISSDDVVLAHNEPYDTAIFIPTNSETDDPDTQIQQISALLDLDQEFVSLQRTQAIELQKNVVLKEGISHREGIAISSSDTLPIGIEQNNKRVYTDGEDFAHIIGYEGLITHEEYTRNEKYLLTDRIGKTALEVKYESDLRGTHGAHMQLYNSLGEEIRDVGIREAIPGDDVYLNIDASLQRVLTLRLQNEFQKADSHKAAAVAIDPRNGAVRALVSLPTYDNNAFAQGIEYNIYNQWITDENRPLLNRVISGVYPPASTVKPIMAIAALEEGVITPNVQIESRGGLQIGSFSFGDWRAHGFTDMRRAIAVSSDVYFYTVGGGYGDITGMGIDAMAKWMHRFGYGAPTGIDLPQEVNGLYPDETWKEAIIGERWYIGDTYHASIGQGFVGATPLQVANAIVPIANGGSQYVPQIVDYVIDREGNKKDREPYVIATNLASAESLRVSREGMRQTVTEGTAQYMQQLPVAAAGKTGTAEFGIDGRVHSWFVTFAPYENPDLVLAIIVEDQIGTVSSSTVPVARDVLNWYYSGRDPAYVLELSDGEETDK